MEDEGNFDRLDVSLLSAVADDPGEVAQWFRDVGPLIATHWKFLPWHRRVPVTSVSCSEHRLEWRALSAEAQGPRLLYQKSPSYPCSFQPHSYKSRVLVAPDDSSNQNGLTR